MFTRRDGQRLRMEREQRCCCRSKWKGAETAAAKQAQGQQGRKDGATCLAASTANVLRLSFEQERLGWNLCLEGDHVIKS
jgi:hypothetical protein